jgi:hypothetical protein
MTATVSFTNHKGEKISKTLNPRSDKRTWYFNLADAGMTIADARKMVTIEVYDGSTLVCTIKDSMESYVARVIDGGPEGVKLTQPQHENLVALLNRVMMFSDSVKEYVGPWSTKLQEVG